MSLPSLSPSQFFPPQRNVAPVTLMCSLNYWLVPWRALPGSPSLPSPGGAGHRWTSAYCWIARLSLTWGLGRHSFPHCLLKTDPEGARRHQNLSVVACHLEADTYLTLLLGRTDDRVSSNGVLRAGWMISCPNSKSSSWLITPDWAKCLLEANNAVKGFPIRLLEFVCSQFRQRT